MWRDLIAQVIMQVSNVCPEMRRLRYATKLLQTACMRIQSKTFEDDGCSNLIENATAQSQAFCICAFEIYK